MKQFILTLSILLISGILITIIINGSKQKKIFSDVVNNPEIIDFSKSDKNQENYNVDILYWGTTCPACHDTIDWIEENNIEEKNKIIRKEVYENEDNSKELIKKAIDCGFNEYEIGVPLMFTKNKKCLVGTLEISSYLKEEVNNLNIKNE